jgi:hypothetical protein
MRVRNLTQLGAAISALALFAPAAAQPAGDASPGAQPAAAEPAVTDANGVPINPDEMAAYLNAQQKIKQSYTLTRTINGEVVETTQETVVFSPGDPVRSTEAGQSPLDSLKARFDAELLTRLEAFEEARLDFVVADVNRDGAVTAAEFVGLVRTWRENEARARAQASSANDREAFLASLDPIDAAQADADAQRKFAAMAGAAAALPSEAYLREYLLDFDASDADRDTLLKAAELERFRALTRGAEPTQ